MGAVISWILGTRLGRAISALLTALVVLWATYVAGKRDAHVEARTESLKAYTKTKEKIDDVEANTDRDDAIERLRRNGWTG